MQSHAVPLSPIAPPLALVVSQARPEPFAIRTLFERYEYKYWMSAPVAERIVDFIRPYVVQDAVSIGCASHQRNTSLYFDTPGYLFWQLHTGSAHSRYKLRIRAYGDPPAERAFFEVKEKVKSVMLKVRGTVPLESIPDVLAGRFSRVPCPQSQLKLLESFLSLRALYRVEPKLLVSYRRTPFVSRNRSEDVRVTIDRDIVYQPRDREDLCGSPNGWVNVPGPFEVDSLMGYRPVLIELKFRGHAPLWMAEMVQRFRLRRTAFSKYVAAVTHLQETASRTRRLGRG